MLTITVQVYAPAHQAQGIKEDLATYLEQYGDSRVVSVAETAQEQIQVRWVGKEAPP